MARQYTDEITNVLDLGFGGFRSNLDGLSAG